MKRLYSATQNSLRGLADGFRTEPALRDEALLVVIGLPLGLLVAPSGAWYAAMIGGLCLAGVVWLLALAVRCGLLG